MATPMSAAFKAGASFTPSYSINISRKMVRKANEKAVTKFKKKNTHTHTHTHK
jgi:hypothetical protein